MHIADRPFVKGPESERNWGFSFESILALTDATITSVVSATVEHKPGVDTWNQPIAAEDPVSLTIENATPNSETYEEEVTDRNGNPVFDSNGDLVTRTVPVGKGVRADIAGGTLNANYNIVLVVGLSTSEIEEGVFPVIVRRPS